MKSETPVSTTEYQRDLQPNCKIAQTKSLHPRSNVSFTERKFHYRVSFALNIVIITSEILQITLRHAKFLCFIGVQKHFFDAVHLLLCTNFVDGEELKEIGELWVI